MDETAVLHAEDNVLKKLGVSTDGDIIRLKLLCKGTDLQSYKENLKDVISKSSNV